MHFHLRPLLRAAGVALSSRLPTICYFFGLVLALVLLYIRLGSATPSILEVWFNADSLYAAGVFHDLFVDNFPLSGLNLPSAPSIFPDILLSQPFFALTPNALVGTIFSGALQFCLLVFAYWLCAQALGPRSGWLINAALFASAIFVTVVSAHTLSIQARILFVPLMHLGSLVMVAFNTSMVLLWLKRAADGQTSRRLAILYTVAVFVASLSDLLFVTQFVVPLTAALAICRYFALFNTRSASFVILATWPSAIAGHVSTWLLPAATSRLPPKGLGSSLHTLECYFRCFTRAIASADPHYLFGTAYIAAALVTAMVLLRRDILPKSATTTVNCRRHLAVLFLLLTVMSAVGSFVSAVIAGIDIQDETLARRFCLPFYVTPLFAWAILLDLWIPTYWKRRRAVERISMLLALIVPAYLIFIAPPQLHPLHARLSPFPLVQLMDGHAQRYGLRYGLGGYWEARKITLLSNSGLHVYPVAPDLSPFPMLANKYWYTGHPNSRHPHPDYSFVMLNSSVYNISSETVIDKFGEPADQFDVGSLRILVYNRASDTRFRHMFQ